MSTYFIKGTLQAPKGLPYANFKISAWDKDKNVSDHLGTAYTDAQGKFTIRFGEDRFFDGVEDNLPDVFFLVYQGDRVIHSTENKPIKNVKELAKVTITLDKEIEVSPTEEGLYTLSGNVLRQNNKQPVQDLKVEAWDKDKKISDQLGVAISDASGAFVISYEPSRFRDDPTDYWPDVFFRIYRGENMIHSTERRPIKNVKHRSGIEILIKEAPTPFIPSPRASKSLLQDLSAHADLPPKSLKKKQPKLYKHLVLKAQNQLAQTTARFFSSGTSELTYFAESLDLSGLVDSKHNTVDYLSEALEKTSFPVSVKEEGLSRLKQWDGPKNLDELIQPELAIKENPLLAVDRHQADVFKIAELAQFKDTLTETLLDHNLTPLNLEPNRIAQLVEAKTITKKQGQTLQFNAGLFTLVQGNMPLARAIKNRNPKKPTSKLVDLAKLDVQDWRTALEDAQVTDDDNALEREARLRQKQVELTFPEAVFKARMASMEQPATRRLMNRFYRANNSFNFLTGDLDPEGVTVTSLDFSGFNEQDQQTVMRELRTNKSLYNITKDATHTFELKSLGYTTGFEIAIDGLADFRQRTGFNEQLAKKYFDRSQLQAFNLNIALGNVMDVKNSPLTNSAVFAISAEADNYLRRFDGYESFFGETDFCKCKHCASIISPAAYFVDLMDFLQKKVMNTYFPGEDVDGSRHHILSPMRRRPDLWSGLVLNCENTHKLEPYLKIINEVLENFMYSQDNGDIIHSELPGDRNQIVNYVYELLSHEAETDDALLINSFDQPFHLALSMLETYLQHFPISRYSIAKAWLSGVEDTHNVLPQAQLEVSSKEYNLILNPRADNLEFIRLLYGITTGTGIPLLDVQELLSVMRLTRKEFSTLINTYFVKNSPPQEVLIEARREGGSLEINKEYARVSVGHLDRMHRFIRLWRSLNWSMNELDSVVEHLHLSKGLPDSEQIRLFPDEIVQFVDLQKTLKTDVDHLCSLINQFPTKGSPSFFDKRFNLEAFVTNESDRWISEDLDSRSTLTFRHPAHGTSSSSDATLHRMLAGLALNDEELFSLLAALKDHLEAPTGASEGTIKITIENLSMLFKHAFMSKRYELEVSELFFLITITPDIATPYLGHSDDITALIDTINWYKKSGYNLAELSLILEGSLPTDTADQDPEVLAYELWLDVQKNQNLLFTDTLFAYEGISEEQSKSIIEANDTIFIPADLQTYRIASAALDPGFYNITIPSPILTTLSAEQLLQIIGLALESIADLITESISQIPSEILTNVSGTSSSDSNAILQANPGIFRPITGTTDQYDLFPAVKSDPALLGLSFPATIWSSLSPEDRVALYTTLLHKVARSIQSGAPEITDRAFVGIASILLEQSREIFIENGALFEKVSSERIYWFEAEASLESPMVIPPSIPITEEVAKTSVKAYHSSTLVPHLIAGKLGTSVQKILDLAALVNYRFEDSTNSSLLSNILQGRTSLRPLQDLIGRLIKLNVWFKNEVFDTTSLHFIRNNSGLETAIFQINIPDDYNAPQLNHLTQTSLYATLIKDMASEKDGIHTLLESYEYDLARPAFSSAELEANSSVLNAKKSTLGVLNGNMVFPASSSTGVTNQAIAALKKLKEINELVQYLGIGAEIMANFVSKDFNVLLSASKSVFTAIRTKYQTEEAWLEKITPFEDTIRGLKRDALVNYLIHSWQATTTVEDRWFNTSNDLYNYFLIDTEFEGCARTSRMVAAISSIQLYIQRCLMNLEQSKDGGLRVKPSDIPKEEWLWRKNYRVWEANRKVFLYPENYIEPDLRDNKTELFEKLESDLLHQEITPQNVLNAYSKYMAGFEEIASLKIAGSFHELDTNVDRLHLFGVTSSNPPEHYYRNIDNLYRSENRDSSHGMEWGNWTKLNLKISARKVSPIMYQDKLFLFWVAVITNPVTEMINGKSQFTGYNHKWNIEYSFLTLDGSWAPIQQLKISDEEFLNDGNVIFDPLRTPEEFQAFKRSIVRHIYIADGSWNIFGPSLADLNIEESDVIALLLDKMNQKIDQDPGIFENSRYIDIPMTVDSSEGSSTFRCSVQFSHDNVKNLYKPMYDNNIHLGYKENYTLRGYQWDRVYPDVNFVRLLADDNAYGNLVLVGANFELTANLDISSSELKTIDGGFPIPIYMLRTSAGEPLADLKRLNLSDRDLSYGYIPSYVDGEQYADCELYLKDEPGDLIGNTRILSFNGSTIDYESINGSLTDGVFSVDDDLLLVHSYERQGFRYMIKRIGTTLGTRLGSLLFAGGVKHLLSYETQAELVEKPLPVYLYSLVCNDGNHGKLDFSGSLGTYYREMFFHAPFLIANHLNSQKKYAEAQRWYHYIFDPMAQIEIEDSSAAEAANYVWQFIEFRNHRLASWKENLNDPRAIEAYKKDPFNPHAVARLRLGAYMKSITMKYIDNLLDWGDHLFIQDTVESINEASLLYIMASEILGPKPAELGECDTLEKEQFTLRELKSELSSPRCKNFIQEVENTIETKERCRVDESSEPFGPGTGYLGILWSVFDASSWVDYYFGTAEEEEEEAGGETGTSLDTPLIDFGRKADIGLDTSDFGGINWKDKFQDHYFLPSFHTSLLEQSCLFCIPSNPDLLSYWDRVQDRLFKIRNCMNISGVRRQLSLFAPEIDPRLLVRARAAGLSLEDVLTATQGQLPPYRFAFLLAKAKEYAGALQGFGAALLGALEKKSAEDLALLRLKQQDEVLKLYTTQLRDLEIKAAEESLEGLLKRKENVELKIRYYEQLISVGLNRFESMHLSHMDSSNTFSLVAMPFYLSSSIAGMPPQIVGMANSTGSGAISKALKLYADYFNAIAAGYQRDASIVSVKGGQERRRDNWEFILEQVKKEEQELEKQIAAAEIRKEISVKSRELHEKSMEQHQETFEFYRDKFTNLGLYTWLSTQLQRLYREAYQNAMTVARMAERAYRFERHDETSVFLEGNYWESTKAGMMAGEKLMSALRRMELKYMETNHRSMEIDQAFSITQIAPEALLSLKNTGSCEFTVPELFFDIFYPGQYRRRIKSARLTIPCITGPYSNVSATLTLTNSYIRKEAKWGSEELALVPPSRSTTVATSTAQNDSGVFRLDFRDERYMPFEGAGAVESTWQLELPKNLKPFDYSSINDVILHISYTAEYDVQFREAVEEASGHLDTLLSGEEFSLSRAFSLRQEFSQTFHRLLHGAVGEQVPLELGERHFPLFLQGKRLEISSARCIVELDENGFRNEDGDVELPAPLSFALNVESNGTTGSEITTWDREENTKLFLGEIPVTTAFSAFQPVVQGLEVNLTVNDSGDLAVSSTTPADRSSLDDHKIKDVVFLIDYKVV
ncbi:neuraminidase-like domain-containing protein [Spongiimicrobium sp. 3-5]|uniref:Tc toxin subunit A-related protein n=1 Tax=Spongiimicrobium sp. 3-5 TaxID=3332596 RepID=UPI00397EEC9B